MIVTWFIVRQSAHVDHWIGVEGAVIITQLLGSAGSMAVEIGSTGIRELFLL